jgi:hypothetical protein
MPMNSTKITANTQVSSIGGNFEGVIYFNGGTASVINVFDNNTADVTLPCNYNNDPTIVAPDTTGLKVGMFVTGTGIPEGATIVSITDGTDFELSASTTGGNTVGGLLTFIDGDNHIAKILVAANSSDVVRGLDIICRNGIKIIANNFTSLEIFALTN